VDPASVDQQSIAVLILGPVSIAALVGAFVWWLTHREPPNGKPPQG
jgi:hypothetical protein